ncbi:MAG TPA: FG-GAP repeat protein [bacterium]|nr:FG-GAP repeat protein [bacterium]
MYGLLGPLTEELGTVRLGQTPPDIMVLGGVNCGSFGTTLLLTDLNADGYDDLLIGDPGATPGAQAGAGQITVLFGRADPPANWTVDFNIVDPDLTLYADVQYANMGSSMATGDYDGDGFADLVCSVMAYYERSRVLIVRGPFDDPTGTVRDFLVEAPDLTLIAPTDGSGFGMNYILADLTGDGKDDLVSESVPLVWGKWDQPLLAVVFGAEISGTAVRDLATDPPEVAVHTGTGQNVPGDIEEIAAADLNGDGAPELIFSDYWMQVQNHAKGGVLAIDNARLIAGASIDLTATPADKAIIGQGQNSYFGRSLSLTNAPSGPVLAVGADSAGHGQTNWCGVVYQMGPTQLAAETIVLDNVAPDMLYFGTNESYSLGQSVLLPDLDGDTLGEVVAGAFGPYLIAANGLVHIFFDRYDLGEPTDDDTTDDDTTDDDTTDDDTTPDDDDTTPDDDDGDDTGDDDDDDDNDFCCGGA